jgi:endo-1,4-beta-xylanase
MIGRGVGISRRNILRASALTTGQLVLHGARSAIAADPTLRAVANQAGLHFGSSSEVELTGVSSYANLITTQCDIFAPNLNWQLLAPSPVITPRRFDPNILLVRDHGLRLTGYHLVWHSGTPKWFRALGPTSSEQALRSHIEMLARNLGDVTFSWNVVNEAINPDENRPDGLRRSPYLEKFGQYYIDMAFGMARDAAPQVLRVYNDYGLELATADHARRRDALLRLLDGWAQRAVPIQAVGLQCHMLTKNFDRFDPKVFRAFLGDIASRGLLIMITELDVLDFSTADVAQRDAGIADIYRRLLSVALDETAVVSVATWGLSDRYTWLNPSYSPRFARPDGSPSRPLPYDDALHAKPIVPILLDVFKHAPRRRLV